MKKDQKGINNPNFRHGMRYSRIYITWQNMNRRCYDEKAVGYCYYGAKGIKVCEEWRNSFQTFYDWAMKNGYTDDLTIDRIDSTKDYCPENCRWITLSENVIRASYGRLRYKDKSNWFTQARTKTGLTLREISKELGIAKGTMVGWGNGKHTPQEWVKRLVVAELERIAEKKQGIK